MAIFNSYVSLPEGKSIDNLNEWNSGAKNGYCFLTVCSNYRYSSLRGTRTHCDKHPSGHRLSLRTRVHLLYPRGNIFFTLSLHLGDPSSDRQWLTGQWLSYPSSLLMCIVWHAPRETRRQRKMTSTLDSDGWSSFLCPVHGLPEALQYSPFFSPPLFWCPSLSLSLKTFTPNIRQTSIRNPSITT